MRILLATLVLLSLNAVAAAQTDDELLPIPCEGYALVTDAPDEDAECVIYLKNMTEEGDYVVQIVGRNLRGGQFPGAMLNTLDLMGADLFEANLQGAYIDGALLNGANLAGADLTGAVLLGTDLTGADLTDANLRGAIITCALLPDGEFADDEDAEALEAIIDDFDCELLEN